MTPNKQHVRIEGRKFEITVIEKGDGVVSVNLYGRDDSAFSMVTVGTRDNKVRISSDSVVRIVGAVDIEWA